VFDGPNVLQSIAGERCSALHGVPTVFIAEPEHQRANEFDGAAAIIERRSRSSTMMS
jgi:hypothetical protein